MDNISTDISKQTAFRGLLHELARKPVTNEDADSYYQRFESIYQDDFRHFYSDISKVMYDIAKYERKIYTDSKEHKRLSEDTSTFISNISYLYNNYPRCDNLKDNLRKLYDHTNLESARMDYSDIGDQRILEQGIKLRDLNTQVKKMSNKFFMLNKKSDVIEKKLSKAQTDYIAILGIFASVVLAFVGGMAFSTSVLNNIKEVSIYRLLTVALIIGMVFVTVIFLMFYFIGVLTGRKLNDEQSLEPLRLSYIVFFALIVFVFVMWCFGIVETRNDTVKKNSESIETSAAPEITKQIDFETNNAAIE